MKTDQNQVIKLQFYNFIEKSYIIIDKQVYLFVKSLELENFNVEQQLEIIYNRLNSLKEKKQSFGSPEYLHYAPYHDALETIYHDNTIFFNNHEEDSMFEALLLHEKIKTMERLLAETQLMLPLFNFESYQRSDHNFVFYRLHLQPFGTSDDDYSKIIRSQAKSRMHCAITLAMIFKKYFRSSTANDDHLYERVFDEVEIVRKLFDHDVEWNDEQFLALIKGLKAMDHYELPKDITSFHQMFLQCLQEPDAGCSLCPNDFKLCLKNIENKKIPDCSVFYLALVKYEEWLNDILYRTLSLNDSPEMYYDELFDKTHEQCILKAVSKMEKLGKDLLSLYRSNKQYENVIHGRIKLLKHDMDHLSIVDYLHYAGDKEMLKCCFVNNCMKTKAVEFHQEELENAIFIDRYVQFYEQELLKMGKGVSQTVDDIHNLNRDALIILSFMVPGKDIINRMNLAFEKAMKAQSNRKPIYYILEDYALDFKGIFKQASDNLFVLLEDQPWNEKLIYASKALKEIEILLFKAKRDGKKADGYYEQIKQLIEIHIHYLTSNQHTVRLNGEKKDNSDEKTDKKLLSFHYKGTEDYLLPVLLKANELACIVATRLEIKYLVRVLMAKDLTQLEVKIKLICNTNVFKCIIESLQPYFKNLSFARIEKCGLFESCLGTPLSASNLSSLSYEKIPHKEKIQNIFK